MKKQSVREMFMTPKNIFIVYTIMVLALGILLLYASVQLRNTTVAVQKSMEEIEAMKVWWADNYAKVKQIYGSEAFRKQQTQQIDAMLSQIWAAVPADQNTNNAQQPAAASATLSSDQLSAVLKDVYVEGNESAPITLIEYSDFECPFCQRFHDAGTVDQILKSYGKDVNVVFKNFPLNSIHPLAQKAAEGALCVAKIKWADAYYSYVDKVFSSKDPSVAGITKVALELGISQSTLENCMSDEAIAQRVEKELTEWNTLFGVTGTPATVVLNTKTGKWKLISGALPFASFEAAIKELIK